MPKDNWSISVFLLMFLEDSSEPIVVCVRACIYLREFKGAVRRERGDLAGVLGDVAVEARCWI